MNGNQQYSYQPRPHVQEERVGEKLTIQVERKTFHFETRENPRGAFMRLTEEVNGRRDNLCVPLTGIEEFHQKLGEAIEQARTAGKL